MTEPAGPIATRGRALVLAILVIGFGAGFVKSFDRAPAGFFQPAVHRDTPVTRNRGLKPASSPAARPLKRTPRRWSS